MRVIRLAILALLASAPAWAQAPAASAAQSGPAVPAAGSTPAIPWSPAPPFFPPGARFAVVQGDPSQPGVYTVRLEMPAGYTIAPHFHPTDEHVTVISGRFMIGMADTVDNSRATTLAPGGFITARANMRHWARAVSRTVVQVHGQGPFLIAYVRPSDDPRNAATAR